jgi:hypothetical protein
VTSSGNCARFKLRASVVLTIANFYIGGLSSLAGATILMNLRPNGAGQRLDSTSSQPNDWRVFDAISGGPGSGPVVPSVVGCLAALLIAAVIVGVRETAPRRLSRYESTRLKSEA